MIVICIFISLTIMSALNYMKTRRKRALITNLSGPLALPLIGSMHKLLLLTPKNFLTKSHNYFRKFGILSHCWVFDRLFILTADYEFVTQLLHSTDHLTTGYNNLLQPVFGDGILRRDGEEWQTRRQLISHALQPQTMSKFTVVFATQAQVLIEQLRMHCDGKTSFDIKPYVERAVVDILSETVLGMEGRAHQWEHIKPVEEREYGQTVLALIKLFCSRFLSLHSANPTIYSILCPIKKRRQKRLLMMLNRINNELITEQRAAATATIDKSNEATYAIQMSESHNEMPTHYHNTLLTMLLTSNIAGEQLSNEEICDELNTFIFQGCLPTPAAISFALVMISRHPSVQEKLLAELRSVWPKGVESDCEVENLTKLKYLESVINETLRLYPPQPIISRDLKHNFNYTHSSCKDGVLPAESEIYINVFEMLRHPKSFTDPECFRPERFNTALSVECQDILSWGLGPRTCIAKKFTMLLIKTVIARLMLTYEILPFGEELVLEVKIVLGSSNGWQVALRERDD